MSQTFTTSKLYIKEILSYGNDKFNIILNLGKTGETNLIEKPTDLLCSSTQNVQNTNNTISVMKRCVEKPQDPIIAKFDASLLPKKNQNKTIEIRRYHTNNTMKRDQNTHDKKKLSHITCLLVNIQF